MAYKCEVIEYSPKADTLAARVEEKANEMLKDGYELVTFSVTNSAKAVLVFKKVVSINFHPCSDYFSEHPFKNR